MPLHDWADARGWDSVHPLWTTDLLRWVKPRLPAGFRVFPALVPALAVDRGGPRPDLTVWDWQPTAMPDEAADPFAPDFETVATFDSDPVMAVHVERHGALVAAVEVVSVRSKTRPNERQDTLDRYAAYLRRRVHLMLVDCLPHPRDFSFADTVAAAVGFPAPPCPAPFAVSYRVGHPLREGGTSLGCRQAALEVGRPLPTLPLALGGAATLLVDLETTYARAAADAYVDDQRG